MIRRHHTVIFVQLDIFVIREEMQVFLQESPLIMLKLVQLAGMVFARVVEIKRRHVQCVQQELIPMVVVPVNNAQRLPTHQVVELALVKHALLVINQTAIIQIVLLVILVSSLLMEHSVKSVLMELSLQVLEQYRVTDVDVVERQ